MKVKFKLTTLFMVSYDKKELKKQVDKDKIMKKIVQKSLKAEA